MEDNRIDWRRLERFIREEGAPAELEELGRWVADDPERAELADAMRTVGRRTGPSSAWPRFDAGRALRRVQRRARST